MQVFLVFVYSDSIMASTLKIWDKYTCLSSRWWLRCIVAKITVHRVCTRLKIVWGAAPWAESRVRYIWFRLMYMQADYIHKMLAMAEKGWQPLPCLWPKVTVIVLYSLSLSLRCLVDQNLLSLQVCRRHIQCSRTSKIINYNHQLYFAEGLYYNYKSIMKDSMFDSRKTTCLQWAICALYYNTHNGHTYVI